MVRVFISIVAIVSLASTFLACQRSSSSPRAPVAPDGGTPCGDLGCMQFDSVQDAMRYVLSEDVRVVAIGEAHAPAGATASSAAKRFTEEILPLLAGRASDLLVELMKPPEACVQATAEVREKQAPATSQQAPTNQNEYVAMGERARALGIVPDMLRPSCADMDRVRDAGDEAIEASLAMIARLSTVQAEKLLDRDARSDGDRDKAVVLYGGMLHNDLEPAADQRAWSYAPALDAKTGGKLVAVDLVVPEFIGDDATWTALPWVARYQRARTQLGGKTTVFRTAEKNYVVVFAASAP
jgi:hypothetical protein